MECLVGAAGLLRRIFGDAATPRPRRGRDAACAAGTTRIECLVGVAFV